MENRKYESLLVVEEGRKIASVAFKADKLEGTKWTLSLYPLERTDENNIGLYLYRTEDCEGPDVIEISYKLSILAKDGSVSNAQTVAKRKFKKNEGWGLKKFIGREKVFVSEREVFLPEDALTVECIMWTTDEKPEKSIHLFATTTIKLKRRSFVWKIDKPSTLNSGIRNKFKDNLIDFDLILNNGFDRFQIEMSSFDENIRYISCNASVIDSEGRKNNCIGDTNFSYHLKKGALSLKLNFPETLMKDKSRFFPNDVLSLDFEYILATVEHFNGKQKCPKLENEVTTKEESKNTAVLTHDFRSLYDDGLFSDMELRTSTKTFLVHKIILSARSPVFRRMFDCDMKEKNLGHVDITDFEDDTIHRMLLYIYTDSIENMQLESAFKLYEAADKYHILPLKSKCSSFFGENLSPANFCKVLILADLHNDGVLKSLVQDYILRQRKEIFFSQEWKDLMNNHPAFAQDLMYRKITNNIMYLPRKRKAE